MAMICVALSALMEISGVAFFKTELNPIRIGLFIAAIILLIVAVLLIFKTEKAFNNKD